MYTYGFIVQVKKEDIYIVIEKDVEKRFNTSTYESERQLLKGKNVIELLKKELGGEIITEFAALRAKAKSYLKDDGDQDKKAKGTKRCVIKQKRKFENYKVCLEAIKYQKEIKQLEKDNFVMIIVEKIIKKSLKAIN